MRWQHWVSINTFHVPPAIPSHHHHHQKWRLRSYSSSPPSPRDSFWRWMSLSRAIGADVRTGSAWGRSKNRPEISYLVIVGFFRDRVMQIDNDGHFTVNFTLFKHYFWLTLLLELCKSGCVNKISPLFRSWLHIMPFSMNTGPINKKCISAKGWDLMLSSVYFMLMESEAWRSSLGYKTLQWEFGQKRAYCEN